MRPCVGIPDVCPPLCTKAEIDNGTYTLADIEEMNQAIEEALDAALLVTEKAKAKARSRSPR
ncbi:hypothetical protein VPHK367G1_0051 [Vibrio phage K367 g1]|nr:hypothetical protein MYOV072v1_p0065 [Vibrio phage 207E29.1]